MHVASAQNKWMYPVATAIEDNDTDDVNGAQIILS